MISFGIADHIRLFDVLCKCNLFMFASVGWSVCRLVKHEHFNMSTALGSLASFDTSVVNTEGVPLLEENEFESGTNSVSKMQQILHI